jgi:two-component system response regulator FixJ
MTRTIHIIDDDDEMRLSLHRLLSIRQDLHIRSYKSGDEFLTEAPELDPGLLLLDMKMPGSTGMDVLREIASMNGRFGAIILTGEGNIQVATEAMKAGAIDFLEKPYKYETLIATIEVGFAKLEEESEAKSRQVDASARIARLSARETDVLKGLINGSANKVIAHELDISPRTVEIYRANLMNKLEVRSLSEALRIAFAAGLFPHD